MGACHRLATNTVLVGGLAEQVLESASGALVPGPRVDASGLDTDPVAGRPMTRRVDLGDAIQQRSIERGQLLGRRLLIHRWQNGPLRAQLE